MKFKIKADVNDILDTKQYNKLKQDIQACYNQCFNDKMITIEEFLKRMKQLYQKYEFYEKYKMFEPEDYED